MPESVIVTVNLEHPVKVVWKAITEHTEMLKWFFREIPEFRPEPGFETTFDVISGGRNFRHEWCILEVVENQKITYRWNYGEYPGSSKVIFELFRRKAHTELKLTHTGLESFPRKIPEFSRESCLAGWNYFLGKRLKSYLDAPNLDDTL